MWSKLTSTVAILRRKGPLILAKKITRFLVEQTVLQTGIGRQFLYDRSLKEVRDRMKEEEQELDDILDTVLDIKPGLPPYQISAIQVRDEIKALTSLVEKEQPKSVLEIGTAKGGSFYIWSRYLDTVDKLISLDLPGGRFGGGYDEQKTNIFSEFAPSIEMHFIRDNSHQESTLDAVSELVDEPIDFLFIDGDHTYEGVKKDFEMYSELVSDGGIIALHDIVHDPHDPDCNVDQFWSELVEEYETEEIIHTKQTWGGIGVVRV